MVLVRRVVPPASRKSRAPAPGSVPPPLAEFPGRLLRDIPGHTSISSYAPADISHTGGPAGGALAASPSRRGRAGRSRGRQPRLAAHRALARRLPHPPTPPVWEIAHTTVGRSVYVSGSPERRSHLSLLYMAKYRSSSNGVSRLTSFRYSREKVRGARPDAVTRFRQEIADDERM